jgi:hypothetical protein
LTTRTEPISTTLTRTRWRSWRQSIYALYNWVKCLLKNQLGNAVPGADNIWSLKIVIEKYYADFTSIIGIDDSCPNTQTVFHRETATRCNTPICSFGQNNRDSCRNYCALSRENNIWLG